MRMGAKRDVTVDYAGTSKNKYTLESQLSPMIQSMAIIVCEELQNDLAIAEP